MGATHLITGKHTVSRQFAADEFKSDAASRCLRLIAVVLLVSLWPAYAHAQSENNDSVSPRASVFRVVKFLAGGAAGLGMHEGGHLLFDGVFGVRPVVRHVSFGPFPFFAISHQAGLPRRKEFTISSAGFWMQHVSSEVILARHPHLRNEKAPLLKGILAFNVLTSIGYAAAAAAIAGPPERDTRAMAESARVSEPLIGLLIATPALLDAYRYFHPDARWAKWLSRGVKVGDVLLVVR